MREHRTYSHIRMSRYVMLHLYIAIHRYINIRAKSSHANTRLTSNKGHHGHPRAMIFRVVSPYTANGIFLPHELKSRQLVTK